MSYIHYIYVKVYYSVHTSDTPNKLSTIYSISLFLQIIWRSKFEAMPTHSGDQMVSDQAITWSGIRGLSAIRGGMAPLRLYPNPSFLLKLLAFCKREGEGGGQRKGFLPAFFQVCPSGSSIEGSSGCCCAPAALSTTVLGLKSFWSIRWSQMWDASNAVCCQYRVAVGSHQHWIGSIFFRGEEVKSAVSLKDPGYQIVDPYNASTDEQIKWSGDIPPRY